MIIYAISMGVIILFGFNIIAFIRTGGNTYIFDWFGYLFLGLLSYYVSIAGYFIHPRQLQKLHFDASRIKDSLPEEQLPVKEISREISEDMRQLLVYMETQQPFLQADLCLSDLAKQLKTNTSALSKLINDGTGRNFNDFINQYRVHAVIDKLKAGEQAKQTLLGIAYDAGFNSKATFNRSFKKITGQTPKDYMQQLAHS